MSKVWIIAFFGVAIFANVAICNDQSDFMDLSIDLIQNLPKYFKEAIEEIQKEDATNASNSTETTRSRWISSCARDFLYVYWAMIRDRNIMDWPFQGIPF